MQGGRGRIDLMKGELGGGDDGEDYIFLAGYDRQTMVEVKSSAPSKASMGQYVALHPSRF